MTPKAGRHKPPVVSSTTTTPGTTTTVTTTTTTETSSLEEATTSNLRPLRHVEANVVRHGEPLTSSLSFRQCCGSVTFWYGSGCGSSDPFLWLTDPDGDPVGPEKHDPEYWYIYIILQRFKEIKVFLIIFAWWWKDPYLWLRDPDADPGGPKTYGIRMRIRIRNNVSNGNLRWSWHTAVFFTHALQCCVIFS